jgi:hypothetical protein
MTVELNNSGVAESDVSQEPSGLAEAGETTEETEAGTEQPAADSGTESKQIVKDEKVNLFKAIEKLSPAEQKAFKEWQADYTSKTQSASELEKKMEQYQGYLDNLGNDPEIQAILKARQAKAQAEQLPDFSKMSEEEIFNWTVDKRVEEKVSALEKKIEAKYGTWYQSELADKGNKMINEFAESKKVSVDEAKDIAKYAVAHSMSLDEAYKVHYFDKIPQQAKQEALEDLELKKKANLELGNIPTGVAPILPKFPSIREAAEAAAKEHGIKI